MKGKKILVCAMLANMAQTSFANIESETVLDSTSMNEVVITGSRHATDSRHLPMTVNIIDRKTLTENERTNIIMYARKRYQIKNNRGKSFISRKNVVTLQP